MRKRSLFIRLAAIAILFTVAVTIGTFILRKDDRLPIYHPSQLDPRLVDPSARQAYGVHHIKDFNLTDQNGATVTLADTKGKVILADFFFTTCGSICPKMSTQMARVQDAFKADDRLILLSHSVTPEMDSVPVLKAYAEKYQADPAHWRLMTGDRKQIYDLARTSYFACTEEGDGGPDDFVHTENLVLVDTLLRIRGFYDGTSAKDVDRAIADIAKLLTEEPEE
jgi:protein SCO1/2